MSSFVIGRERYGDTDRPKVSIDLDLLLKTRLLLTASSGGGKSEAIRLMAERAFGSVPIIIIDPEGEFATLRQKFGYVLVGEGGETPADIRSASLVASKLLELSASAVCDLYELRPSERHEWVKRFLTALIDAPKKLWHSALIVIDEAHVFCPEKGQGESAALQSVIDLCSRGRKRGFCPILATQRLSKLSKNAAAELQNIMVGRTTHVDQDRAADIFRVKPSDKRDFFQSIGSLPDGGFMVMGRAFNVDGTTIQVDRASTKPPVVGGANVTATPTPASVKKMLPQLADLPKEAEAKEKTEADLRAEIAHLRAELKCVHNEPRRDPELEDKHKALIHDHLHKIEAAVAVYRDVADKFDAVVRESSERILSFNDAFCANFKMQSASVPRTFRRPADRKIAEPKILDYPTDANLSGPEKRILQAVSWMHSIGVSEPSQVAVAFLAGYSPNGGAFVNPRGVLKKKGLILYDGKTIRMTDAGFGVAPLGGGERLSNDDLQRKVMEKLPGPERRLLQPLLDAYPHALTNEQLAERAGYAPTGGAFVNPRGRLKSLGLIEYDSATHSSTASDILFPTR